MTFQFNIDGYWDDLEGLEFYPRIKEERSGWQRNLPEIDEYKIERHFSPCTDGYCGAEDCPRCRPLSYDKEDRDA